MIIAGTGHRPDKLGGYYLPNDTYNYVCKRTKEYLELKKPSLVISGMALGFDQWLASIAISLNIPVTAAIPFEGQESVWKDQDKRIYNKLISKCKDVVIVSDGGFAAYKMQIRNEWMVDHCDLLLAAFNGEKGGTHNCIMYARSKKKHVMIIPGIGRV